MRETHLLDIAHDGFSGSTALVRQLLEHPCWITVELFPFAIFGRPSRRLSSEKVRATSWPSMT